jgi:predicted membrane-bound spermidine synthase
VYSVTVVVASFMCGLGIGGLLGGHAADRLGTRRSLVAFACAELFVGLFGLVSKPLYYDVLYQRFSHLAATPALAAVVLFVTLLVPTLAIGLSLPLLGRALTGSLAMTPRVVGMLYGSNTLGASAGALAAPWLLIPQFGLERSLWIAAAFNLVCAALALRLTRVLKNTSRPDHSKVESDAVGRAEAFPFRVWLLIYGLTGFTALGLEIAWFRLLGVLVKSTSFTFGTLLAVYLFGLGAGAAVGARLAARNRRAGLTFLYLQYGATLYAALSTIGLITAIAAGHPIRLVRFLGAYDPVDVYATVERMFTVSWWNVEALTPVFELVVLYLLIPGILIGPSTLMIGMSFPFLQKDAQADFGRLGRRLGTLLAVNIAGGVIGAIVVGWLLLPVVGTAGTLKTLVGTGALLALPIALLRSQARTGRAALMPLVIVVVTTVVVLAMPSGPELWARLHATAPGRMVFDEDGAGLSLIKFHDSTSGGPAQVYVNGLGQSWLPYGHIHTALGALPAFLHPAPADVAIIGLGSGDTTFAAAGRAEIERLVSIEILSAQRRTLEQFLRFQRYPGLLAVLTDRRIEHRFADGRAYIAQAGRKFDIIEADALRPSSAYAGNLYSLEYFMLLHRHLKSGGLAVTWAPTERIKATFLRVFPHVLMFPGDICVGSSEPIPFEASRVLDRAATAQQYYATAGIDIRALLRPYLEGSARRFGPADSRPANDLNTDMFPRDEFALPF